MDNVIELRTDPRKFEKGDTVCINDDTYQVISINTEFRSFDCYTLKKLTNKENGN